MPDPRYRRIAGELRFRIDSGEFSHGAQLPTELELRRQYDASRNTVRDAVKWLIGRGLVETRPGQGTFVVERIDPLITPIETSGRGLDDFAAEVAALARKPTVSAPRVEILQAAGLVASELQVAAGSSVVSRFQQRYIDGMPWSLQTTYYPMSLVDQGAVNLIRAVDMPNGAVNYLEKTLGIKQVGWREKIKVRPPDAAEATFFILADDGRVAVFETLRTPFDEAGRPLRLRVTVYPADRNQFVLNVGRVPPGDATGARGTSPGPGDPADADADIAAASG
jgi:GntR family transcriptional regulator